MISTSLALFLCLHKGCRYPLHSNELPPSVSTLSYGVSTSYAFAILTTKVHDAAAGPPPPKLPTGDLHQFGFTKERKEPHPR